MDEDAFSECHYGPATQILSSLSDLIEKRMSDVSSAS
jgi:hypothetical protein